METFDKIAKVVAVFLFGIVAFVIGAVVSQTTNGTYKEGYTTGYDDALIDVSVSKDEFLDDYGRTSELEDALESFDIYVEDNLWKSEEE